MFSKACEYGIKAVLFVAKQSETNLRPNIKEISKAINSPEPFTAKICQQLVRSNVLFSKKGPNGGFYLEQNLKLKLIDIVMAIDGGDVFTKCILGLSQCSSKNPCPIHDQFVSVRTGLMSMSENTTILGLVTKLNDGETFLKAEMS